MRVLKPAPGTLTTYAELRRGFMVAVKRVVLDVLKPHQPNALDFSRTIAAVGPDYRVHLMVLESSTIDFDALQASINAMGGSLHSIDEVEVENTPEAG
jgi:hypothetical protein